MEIAAQHGIINLIITLTLYAGLILSMPLLFSRKTVSIGLLSITTLVSIGAILMIYSYWQVDQLGVEVLVAWLFAPISALLISYALLIRLTRKRKVSDIKILVKTTLKSYLPKAIAILISTIAVYAILCKLLNAPFNLLTPYIITIFIAIAWGVMKTHKNIK